MQYYFVNFCNNSTNFFQLPAFFNVNNICYFIPFYFLENYCQLSRLNYFRTNCKADVWKLKIKSLPFFLNKISFLKTFRWLLKQSLDQGQDKKTKLLSFVYLYSANSYRDLFIYLFLILLLFLLCPKLL